MKKTVLALGGAAFFALGVVAESATGGTYASFFCRPPMNGCIAAWKR